jgi:hypothetical protein
LGVSAGSILPNLNLIFYFYSLLGFFWRQRANERIINVIWCFWPKNLRQKLQNALTIFSLALWIGTKRVEYSSLVDDLWRKIFKNVYIFVGIVKNRKTADLHRSGFWQKVENKSRKWIYRMFFVTNHQHWTLSGPVAHYDNKESQNGLSDIWKALFFKDLVAFIASANTNW